MSLITVSLSLFHNINFPNSRCSTKRNLNQCCNFHIFLNELVPLSWLLLFYCGRWGSVWAQPLLTWGQLHWLSTWLPLLLRCPLPRLTVWTGTGERGKAILSITSHHTRSEPTQSPECTENMNVSKCHVCFRNEEVSYWRPSSLSAALHGILPLIHLLLHARIQATQWQKKLLAHRSTYTQSLLVKVLVFVK